MPSFEITVSKPKLKRGKQRKKFRKENAALIANVKARSVNAAVDELMNLHSEDKKKCQRKLMSKQTIQN